MLSLAKKSVFFLLFSLFSLSACAAHPQCDGVENWASSMAFVHLKNAGILTNEETDFSKTLVYRIASEDKGSSKYHQVHRVTFYKKDGTKVTTITENVASNMECSEGPVTVYIVSGILGANGA